MGVFLPAAFRCPQAWLGGESRTLRFWRSLVVLEVSTATGRVVSRRATRRVFGGGDGFVGMESFSLGEGGEPGLVFGGADLGRK